MKRRSYIELSNNIVTYMPFYAVNEDGLIYNRSGVMLGSLNKSTGYVDITLWNKDVKSSIRLSAHVLVAIVHVPNPKPDEYNYVNHKNGIKTDNRPDNLEWCTQAMNIQYAFDNGTKVCPFGYGDNHSSAKLTEEQVFEIRDSYIPRVVTQQYLARKYGVSDSVICNIINRKAWTHI